MSLFALFKPRLFTSLSAASIAPASCRRLHLFVGDSLEHTGAQFLQLSRLQELYIQGDTSKLFSCALFGLPAEIGQLRTLQKLSFLNLPIDFPEWIINLKNLRYLMVRGTDLTSIPPWISELKHLHTLLVEVCDITTLPDTMRHMNHLQGLGLCDTHLLQVNPEQLPQSLKWLHFAGSACCTKQKLTEIQAALKSTKVSPDPNHPGFRTKADLERLFK